MKINTLYLSYDGMTDPLGQSQVLPYLIGLSKLNYSITLISFEKPHEYELHQEKIRSITDANGINWIPQTYTKRPPVISTIWDIYKLKKLVFKLYKLKQFKLVHCRSYITALIGLKLKNKKNVKFLFDMRGFWADERVDGGQWKLSNPIFKFVYNYFKKKEKQYFEQADSVISLTEIGKKEILSWENLNIQDDKFFVIPCCCDLDHFDYQKIGLDKKSYWKNELHLNESNINLGYLGNFSTVYMFEETLDVYKKLKSINTNLKFIIMTKEPLDLLNTFLSKAELLEDSNIQVVSLTREQVPEVLSLLDYSIFFCQPSFARKATSPTRMAELLACGVKIITNDKIGDTTQIVLSGEAGYVLDDFSEQSKDRLLLNIHLEKRTNPQHLRNVSLKHFSLSDGVHKYNEAYLNALR